MTQRSELVFTVDTCPRCGQKHDDLEFNRMESSIDVWLHPDDWEVRFDLWAMCPTKAEPILGRVIGEGEVEVR